MEDQTHLLNQLVGLTISKPQKLNSGFSGIFQIEKLTSMVPKQFVNTIQIFYKHCTILLKESLIDQLMPDFQSLFFLDF